MSLTSLLRDEDSALSVWLAKQLPNIAAVRSAYRAALPVRRVRRPVALAGSVVRWDTLGTAIDHRLRCAFTTTGSPVAVEAGIEFATRLVPASTARRVYEVGQQVLNERARLLDACEPDQRGRRWPLEGRSEERLAQVCYAMAWFEEVFRAGKLRGGTPISEASNTLTVNDMLRAVPSYVVTDIRVQVTLAEHALASLRDATTAGDCVPGPVFAGSGDAGGADGDLIVRGLLMDIKTTGRPEQLRREAIYQLAGYVLLDYPDRYRIDSVGLYMSRIGWLISWPVKEFFGLLGARSPLSTLREQCAVVLQTA
jgi:hypothetical protein